MFPLDDITTLLRCRHIGAYFLKCIRVVCMCLCMHVRLCDERRFSVIFGLCVTVCIHLCVCFFLCVFMCLLGRNCCEWERRGILLAQGMIGFYWAPNWHWHHHSTQNAQRSGGNLHHQKHLHLDHNAMGSVSSSFFLAHVLYWVANFRRANWMIML